MKLYHVTTAAAARRITELGFRDGQLTGFLVNGRPAKAVSLLASPGDENDGARSSEACIEVDVPEAVANEHEHLVEILGEDPPYEGQPPGARYLVAEWSIPAAELNRHPRRILTAAQLEEVAQIPRRVRFR